MPAQPFRSSRATPAINGAAAPPFRRSRATPAIDGAAAPPFRRSRATSAIFGAGAAQPFGRSRATPASAGAAAAQPRPAWRSRAVPVVAVVATVLVLAMCTVGASGPATRIIPPVIGGSAVAAVIWAVRRWRADRADYERRLTEWAATEAVLEERLRIARDLHDLVSHGLGLITVRAASTRHLPKPPEVGEALTDIEEASRHATAELRRMLTVLREPGAGGPRTPLENLDALPGIVRAAEAAGLRPRLAAEPLGEVTQGVQVAVCRTVREGLSNTARHAGPSSDVLVRVHRDGSFVVVSVADRGPSTPGWRAVPGAGHGLDGLRERITSLGGTLLAEPVDGGFRLTARIPDEAGA